MKHLIKVDCNSYRLSNKGLYHDFHSKQSDPENNSVDREWTLLYLRNKITINTHYTVWTPFHPSTVDRLETPDEFTPDQLFANIQKSNGIPSEAMNFLHEGISKYGYDLVPTEDSHWLDYQYYYIKPLIKKKHPNLNEPPKSDYREKYFNRITNFSSNLPKYKHRNSITSQAIAPAFGLSEHASLKLIQRFNNDIYSDLVSQSLQDGLHDTSQAIVNPISVRAHYDVDQHNNITLSVCQKYFRITFPEDQSRGRLYLPGHIITQYRFTEQKGYELTSITTSCSLLRNLILGDHDVNLSAQEFTQAYMDEEIFDLNELNYTPLPASPTRTIRQDQIIPMSDSPMKAHIRATPKRLNGAFKPEMREEYDIQQSRWKRRYCEGLIELYRLDVAKLASEQPGALMTSLAQSLLAEFKKLEKLACDKNDIKIDPFELAKILVQAHDLLVHPDNPDIINEFLKTAQDVSRHSWGKVLGGVMLAIGCAAIIALASMAAFAGFGVLAPITLIGMAISTSPVVGALATSTSVLATVGIFGGAYISHEGINDQTLILDQYLTRKFDKLQNSVHALKATLPDQERDDNESNRESERAPVHT